MGNWNRKTVVVNNANGKPREIADIPDLWHIAGQIAQLPEIAGIPGADAAELVLQVWHNAHDLKDAICKLEKARIIQIKPTDQPATVREDSSDYGIGSEPAADYSVEHTAHKEEEKILARARAIVQRRLERRSEPLTAPRESADYLRDILAGYESEVFGCLFLDNRNRVIRWSELFYGTIDGASVYPREVVKAALACNAAAVILAHNHPSGISDESQADVRITEALKGALATVDVRLLDHFIVGGEDVNSLAERGLI